jgi:hypothetical protein
MRYDDEEHLKAYTRHNSFPKIHDDLYAMVREHAEGRSFLDLCCCYGLLGERVRQGVAGARVIGVEGNMSSVDKAERYGVKIRIHRLRILPRTLEAFVALVKAHEVSVILARRCLSEIFVADHQTQPKRDHRFAEDFREGVLAPGVREFVIQGRAPTSAATWPIKDVDDEIQMLVPTYDVVERRGQCAYLRAP